ncbi:hypothetical protein LCGC14_0500390 [marine sediment metagenome]|uniref:Uncharacterized protein n=1 Tax=marine sediment metagenome TaxID=412755 RepID=A0A0F9UR08_9ZZZZ
MSQHTHTICDGCGEQMDLRHVGVPIHGHLGVWGGAPEDVHFHNVGCMAAYMEAWHNKRSDKVRIVVEDLEESDES